MKRQLWRGDLVELFNFFRQDMMVMHGVLQADKAFIKSQGEARMSSSTIWFHLKNKNLTFKGK